MTVLQGGPGITAGLEHTLPSVHWVSRALSPDLPLPLLEMDGTSLFFSLVSVSSWIRCKRECCSPRSLGYYQAVTARGECHWGSNKSWVFLEQAHSRQKEERGDNSKVRGLNSPIRVRGPISVSPKAAQEEVASSRLCALREEGGGLHFSTHPTPSHSKIRTCVVFNFRLILRDIIFPKKLWPSKQRLTLISSCLNKGRLFLWCDSISQVASHSAESDWSPR